MFLDPNQLSDVRPSEILEAAAQAHLALDRRFIHALLSRPEESLKAAQAFAQRDRTRDVVDLAPDLLALFRCWKAAEALPFLIEQIRHDPQEIPDEATELFVVHSREALEPLLALYAELPEEDGGEVAFILANLRLRDPRIFEILKDRLEFDLADGALLLGLYGDAAALPLLDQATSQLKAGEEELREELREARDAIAENASREPIELDGFDIDTLYPETADLPVDLLDEDERTELLKHPIEAVRAAAANSFFNRELSGTQRQALLELAKKDPSELVRARAWESLSLSTEHPEVVESMLAAMRKTDLSLKERGGLAIGLAAEADRNEVRSAIQKLYDTAARAKAMEAMWRSMHASFRDYFARHLDDEDLEVRRAALWGVGYYGIRSELEKIRLAFDDEELRSDALFAYTLALPGEVSRGRVNSMFSRVQKEAKGLTEMEEELVKTALDEKLMLAGKEPFFAQQED